MLGRVLKKIIGTQNERVISRLKPQVDNVAALEPTISALSDEALKAKTDEFRSRLKKGETPEDLLVEAYAVVREVSKRVLKMRHFDVQIMGGIALHQGKIAEMSTGEGKTLVATLPVYLNALEGKGVHMVTVNDYLARRDRDWMGPIYEFLGLSVGVIQHNMEFPDRKAAYLCDITFGTNNEFGFDYLRDNMAVSSEARVQRSRHFAIIDEVDSILVDEARTPLIISGPAEDSVEKYVKARKAAMKLSGHRIVKEEVDPEWKEKLEEAKKEFDYVADEKARTIMLTDRGETNAAKHIGVDNLHGLKTIDDRHQIITALRAIEFFKKDVDYVVSNDQVVIVDEFTGRLMPGRRFSDGLHQALEAKESVKIERENQTLATITFQNFFRMYDKLAGMTGTATTEAVEFEKIYKLDVVSIPTNRVMRRKIESDCIYRTQKEKFDAVLITIKDLHARGCPVLVGTISIETSEYLGKLLSLQNMPHTVLNAKYHEQEADIISRAGQEGAITIATNMAGRGTDIVLGPGVAEKGGLHVLGTERHESRRIDNQLRGRCGRQGDPGASKFYLSLDDDLMRMFGSDKISGLMQKLGMEEGQEIEHPFVSKAIETAQQRVEGRNFDIRKHLLEYDDVMNRQREIIYTERNTVLESEDLISHMQEVAQDVASGLALNVSQEVSNDDEKRERAKAAFDSELRTIFGIASPPMPDNCDAEEIETWTMDLVAKAFQGKSERLGGEMVNYLIRAVFLQVLDSKWKDHLHSLDELREGIHLRAYAQTNPLVEYKREAFEMFAAMTQSIKEEVCSYVFRLEPARKEKITTVFDNIETDLIHEDAESLSSVSATDQSTANIRSQQTQLQGLGLQSNEGNDPRQKTARREEAKVGRNDPCPCGSGRKHKKCCGS